MVLSLVLRKLPIVSTHCVLRWGDHSSYPVWYLLLERCESWANSDPERRTSRVKSQSGYLESKSECCPPVWEEDMKSSSSEGKLHVMCIQRKEKSDSRKQRWQPDSGFHAASAHSQLPDPGDGDGAPRPGPGRACRHPWAAGKVGERKSRPDAGHVFPQPWPVCLCFQGFENLTLESF